MRGLKRWLQKLYAVYVRRDQKRIAYYNYIDAGGEILRLDYPLEENSIVIDAGGYIGDFVDEITQKFDCKVDVFEPVANYAGKIRERFSSNSKVQLISAGLGGTEREEPIIVKGLGSSIFGEDENAKKEKIKIMSIVDYIQSKDYSAIDLMKINIEGGEYELMDSLLDRPDIIKRINYFQIQFHDFVPNAQKMRTEIQKKLSKTHKLQWDFPFIWESWEITS